MELQEKCKMIRVMKGWTQKQLANQIGTTQTEISFIERGFIPPHIERVEMIETLYSDLVFNGKENNNNE